jgi:hypothetical protein
VTSWKNGICCLANPAQKRVVAKECSIKASEIAENPFEFDRVNFCSVQPLGLIVTNQTLRLSH